MRIALISDIHGNWQALWEVFKDIRDCNIDEIYCLGDVVGYGANPKECLDLIMNEPKVKMRVRANHEQYCLDFETLPDNAGVRENEGAWAGIIHSRAQLGSETIKLFADWPEIDSSIKLDITLAHGAVSFNYTERYVEFDNLEEARLELTGSETAICFLGHTHVPFIFSGKEEIFSNDFTRPHELIKSQKYVINVGSVGQPRDHDPQAAYGIFEADRDKKSFFLRRVVYNVNEAARAIRQAGLPLKSASRLARGA
jgi:predicted phosphodiesterase